MSNGQLKYTSILQCFRLIRKEEGLMSMYGGLTPHLLRAVPSTAIMFGVFEAVMKFLADPR
jgi:solute carrier family 25 protein 33/36